MESQLMQLSPDEIRGLIAGASSAGAALGIGLKALYDRARNGRTNGAPKCPYHRDLAEKVDRIEQAITGERGIRVLITELKKDMERLCEDHRKTAE